MVAIHPRSVEGTHLVLCTVFVIYPPLTGWFAEAKEEKVKLEWGKQVNKCMNLLGKKPHNLHSS